MCTFCYLLYFTTFKRQFRDKICYFLLHPLTSQWKPMHHLRHGRFGLHPFCISECIGPESFSKWNLLWHHHIFFFRALCHGRFVRWAMHRMQIVGARIGLLMQIAKSNLLWCNEAFDSSHGGKDMQTLYANKTNKCLFRSFVKRYPSKLTENKSFSFEPIPKLEMNLIFQLSTKIEEYLYCEMPTM
jgi:hypothetical protein